MDVERSRQVVEAVYLTDTTGKVASVNYGPVKLFTDREESVMKVWEEALNTGPMLQIVNRASDSFGQVGNPMEVPIESTKNWIEQHQILIWNGLQQTFRNRNENVSEEFAPCLRLLCYMLCLSAVAKNVEKAAEDLLIELAVHVWVRLIKDIGGSKTPEEIKFLPQEDSFWFLTKNEMLFKQLWDNINWVRASFTNCWEFFFGK